MEYEDRACQRLRRAVEEAAKGNGVVSTGVWRNGEWLQKALGTDGKWYARVLKTKHGVEYWGDWGPVVRYGLPDGVEYAAYHKTDIQVILKKAQ